jgi:DNA-binding winged helix-turn-helix (wHTH) protein
MPGTAHRFADFILDPAQRQLRRGGERVELNARYFDALALLVREHGQLVSKDRFLDEVWNGVPVTEEALTQCIRTLRRSLGDNASDPAFIETVPKHGYRFIAPVTAVDGDEAAAATPATGWTWRSAVLLAAAGTTGAGVAGILGGLFYGFAGASQPLAPGMGAVSMLLVMVCLTIVAAIAGGAGVSLGIAAATLLPGRRWRWTIAGAAIGGMLVGAVVKLLGLDAFNLLLGRSPGDITGGAEGLVLGAAVGFGVWFGARGGRTPFAHRSVAAAGIAGAVAGVVIALAGGRLMGGSLALLADSFDGSRLRLDRIGALFGETGYGPISHAVTGAMEGALFGACIVGAIVTLSPIFTQRR